MKIHVLYHFRPYRNLLKPNYYENVKHCNWRCVLRSIFGIFFHATALYLSLPTMILLGIWYLIESEADLKNIVVSLPLLISLLEIYMTFIAMTLKNHTISETLNQLQEVVDRRKLGFTSLNFLCFHHL